MRHLALGIGTALLGAALGGCSAEEDGSGRRARDTGGSDPFGNSSAAAAGAQAPGDFGNSATGTGGALSPPPPVSSQVTLGDEEVCDADIYQGERTQLDIYMMVDDSGSMVPWWPGTLDALNQFFASPDSAGIGVGVQFFGDSDNCDPSQYATPRVPIAPLPGNTQNLQLAFPLIPIEGTPTQQAMEGAIVGARNHAMANPGAKTVVLLVTDGLPDDCGSTVDGVVQVTAEGYQGSPSIQTFVVGIGDLGALDRFAVAGGSDKAFIVAPGAADQLVAALNQIREQALPCDFRLPEGDGSAPVDPARVNLRYTQPGGEQVTIGAVPDRDRCDPQQGGWYYDDPTAPSRLIACDNSCQQLNSVGGEVKVLLGCPTVQIVPE